MGEFELVLDDLIEFFFSQVCNPCAWSGTKPAYPKNWGLKDGKLPVSVHMCARNRSSEVFDLSGGYIRLYNIGQDTKFELGGLPETSWMYSLGFKCVIMGLIILCTISVPYYDALLSIMGIL